MLKRSLFGCKAVMYRLRPGGSPILYAENDEPVWGTKPPKEFIDLSQLSFEYYFGNEEVNNLPVHAYMEAVMLTAPDIAAVTVLGSDSLITFQAYSFSGELRVYKAVTEEPDFYLYQAKPVPYGIFCGYELTIPLQVRTSLGPWRIFKDPRELQVWTRRGAVEIDVPFEVGSCDIKDVTSYKELLATSDQYVIFDTKGDKHFCVYDEDKGIIKERR